MANKKHTVIILCAFIVAICGRSLPVVDPGLFVISGVSTCGSGSGYCLLGMDCTLNEDFLPDNSNGHCEGLKTAFTPTAYFVCCRYNNKSGTDKPVITLPVLWSSLPLTEQTTEFIIIDENDTITSKDQDDGNQTNNLGNQTNKTSDNDLNNQTIVEDIIFENLTDKSNTDVTDNVLHATTVPFSHELNINNNNNNNNNNHADDGDNNIDDTKTSYNKYSNDATSKSDFYDDGENERKSDLEMTTVNLAENKKSNDIKNEILGNELLNNKVDAEKQKKTERPEHSTQSETITKNRFWNPTTHTDQHLQKYGNEAKMENLDIARFTIPELDMNGTHFELTTLHSFAEENRYVTYVKGIEEIGTELKINNDESTEMVTKQESYTTEYFKIQEDNGSAINQSVSQPESENIRTIDVSKEELVATENKTFDELSGTKANPENENSERHENEKSEMVTTEFELFGNQNQDTNEHVIISEPLPQDTMRNETQNTDTLLIVDNHSSTQKFVLNDNVEDGTQFIIKLDTGLKNSGNHTQNLGDDILNNSVENHKNINFAKFPIQKFLLPGEPVSLYNRITFQNDKHGSKDEIFNKSTVSRDVLNTFFSESVNSRHIPPAVKCVDLVNFGYDEWKIDSEINCQNKWKFSTDEGMICFGVLLNPLWLLTPASCIMRLFQAGIDKVHVSSIADDVNKYRVSNMIVHENYKSIDEKMKLEMNNIGLVSLTRSANTRCVPCIPQHNQDFNGSLCYSYQKQNDTKHGPTPCEGKVSSQGISPDTYLTLPCKTKLHLVQNIKNAGIYQDSLWCDEVLAGIETSSYGGMLTYTPVSNFVEWITQNIQLYS